MLVRNFYRSIQTDIEIEKVLAVNIFINEQKTVFFDERKEISEQTRIGYCELYTKTSTDFNLFKVGPWVVPKKEKN